MKIDNQLHQELLTKIIQASDQPRKRGSNYTGTGKISYQLKAAGRKQIVKQFKKNHPQLTKKEFIDLLDSLSLGKSADEIYLIGRLLQAYSKLRKQLAPDHLQQWLKNVEGWAEVDVICQSTFTTEEMIAQWKQWQKLFSELVVHENIHKRRASLVLLTKPLRDSDKDIFVEQAINHVEQLKHEQHKLITKAISWVLRTMVKHHQDKVKVYLKKNKETLPAIAVRETTNKLTTGKK
jgi:3-methyladenine DNA glycosylase AlkD